MKSAEPMMRRMMEHRDTIGIDGPPSALDDVFYPNGRETTREEIMRRLLEVSQDARAHDDLAEDAIRGVTVDPLTMWYMRRHHVDCRGVMLVTRMMERLASRLSLLTVPVAVLPTGSWEGPTGAVWSKRDHRYDHVLHADYLSMTMAKGLRWGSPRSINAWAGIPHSVLGDLPGRPLGTLADDPGLGAMNALVHTVAISEIQPGQLVVYPDRTPVHVALGEAMPMTDADLLHLVSVTEPNPVLHSIGGMIVASS